jgi:hypothetical protein
MLKPSRSSFSLVGLIAVCAFGLLGLVGSCSAMHAVAHQAGKLLAAVEPAHPAALADALAATETALPAERSFGLAPDTPRRIVPAPGRSTRLAATDPGAGEDSDADTETALIDPGDPEPVPA